MSIQESTCIHSDDNEPDKDSGGQNDGIDDEGYAGWWLCSQYRQRNSKSEQLAIEPCLLWRIFRLII